eukprot:8111735-Alexandrium_andersonii.AAC.2
MGVPSELEAASTCAACCSSVPGGLGYTRCKPSAPPSPSESASSKALLSSSSRKLSRLSPMSCLSVP